MQLLHSRLMSMHSSIASSSVNLLLLLLLILLLLLLLLLFLSLRETRGARNPYNLHARVACRYVASIRLDIH